MKKEIHTSIIINASTARVWEVLTDFENYHQWNPFIKSIEGSVLLGNKIKVEVAGSSFKPKVLVFTEMRELKWLGHFLIKGLFDGEHRFELQELSNGQTRFLHSEKFAGLLLPLLVKKLDTELFAGFEAMNTALKNRAEKTL